MTKRIITDDFVIDTVAAEIEKDRFVTFNFFKKKHGINPERIRSLHASGRIPTMPKATDPRTSGRIGAKLSPWRKGLSLPGSTPR